MNLQSNKKKVIFLQNVLRCIALFLLFVCLSSFLSMFPVIATSFSLLFLGYEMAEEKSMICTLIVFSFLCVACLILKHCSILLSPSFLMLIEFHFSINLLILFITCLFCSYIICRFIEYFDELNEKIIKNNI